MLPTLLTFTAITSIGFSNQLNIIKQYNLRQALPFTSNDIDFHKAYAHQRHLLNSSKDTITTTINNTVENNKHSQNPYAKWAFWKKEWWQDDEWSDTRIITISIIFVIIIACSVTCIVWCVYYCSKACHKKKRRHSPRARSKAYKNNTKYNTIHHDTDTEDDNIYITEIVIKNKPDSENTHEAIQNTDKSGNEHNKGIKVVIADAKLETIASEIESESECESLFGDYDGVESANLIPTANSAGFVAKSQINNQQTACGEFVDESLSISLPATPSMNQDSIKGSLEAAGKTVQCVRYMTHISINNDNSVHNLHITEGGNITEGWDFDGWLKKALQSCCPENWSDTFCNFKKQRITEIELIDLHINAKDKAEMWKELIPIIGDRMRFQKAWKEELIRRELYKIIYTPQ